MKTAEERFWEKVEKTDGCWLWTANTVTASLVRGRFWNGKRDVLAHRASWEMAYGPIPDGLFVCHKCDVPLCVRPDHLFLGTHIDNMADMRIKGRVHKSLPRQRGEGHWQAKFTWEQAERIRKEYADGGVTYNDLARKYGVAGPTISLLIRNCTYVKALDGPSESEGAE